MQCFRNHSADLSARIALWVFAALGLLSASICAIAEEPKFRTDGGDAKLRWYQLKPGEFPPEGSGHAISGELIGLDHINRTGILRLDRDDTQRRGEWDRPLPFVLLPYGYIMYHGAPAEFRDVPLGTHLYGQFYVAEPPEAVTRKGSKGAPAEGPFDRAARLEDDFSFSARQQQTWQVDTVDLEAGKLTVTGIGGGADQTHSKQRGFQVNSTTRVWKGHGIGTLADLAAGQSVLLNLTVCGLKGPGRCTDIWLDTESRELATAYQLEVHRQFQREHGLAGWVDEVDNPQGIVTVTLFGGFDRKLLEDFPVGDVVTAAVAEDSLRTWDQINDRKAGPIVEVLRGPAAPGSSGVRIRFKPALLLEGFRPQRIVRLFSSKWKVDDLPKEERLYQ